MHVCKAEKIRARYFGANGGFSDLSPREAEKKRRELVTGLGKLRKLSKLEPLRDDAIKLFKETIASLRAIRDEEETADMFEQNSRLFERYVIKYENLTKERGDKIEQRKV